MESQPHATDKHFFDLFMVVIGVLIGVTFGLFILANYIAGKTQEVYVLQDPPYQEQVASNILPVAAIALDGDEIEDAGEVATAEPVAEVLSGPQVYNEACLACHGAGVGGAPVVGDAAAWTSRIAQGTDVLSTHVIEGYTGSAGYMPPKGGRMDLSDEEILAAMTYMVEESS
ncbi:MAG: cytochrome c5 family protein [Gammaproteobacteria bacterium]|nr:c-type cytochrome [Gammaproteobacteria bacterium]NND37521.1 cytochrome c5 family protein [Gammaproteobacteria bacterium]